MRSPDVDFEFAETVEEAIRLGIGRVRIPTHEIRYLEPDPNWTRKPKNDTRPGCPSVETRVCPHCHEKIP